MMVKREYKRESLGIIIMMNLTISQILYTFPQPHLLTAIPINQVMSLHHSDDQGESCRVEVAIIGAGPQALTLAASLLESQPYALDDAAELTAKRQRKGLHQKVS